MTAHESIVEQKGTVQGLVPQDINGASLSEDYVSLKNYAGVDVVVLLGNIAGNITLTLKQATAVAGTGEKALSIDHYWIGTGAGKLTKTTASSNQVSIAAASDDNKIIVIPVAASELDVANSFDCIRADFTDPSAAGLVACLYVLGRPRFGSIPDPTID